MKMETNRLEAFSDGVMSIIITIMAFSIPLPERLTIDSMYHFFMGIAVLFVSFIVVGTQWIKHHYLFSGVKVVSIKILWRNLLYLFFISLLPLFAKWMMEHPTEGLPAMGYDIVFLGVLITFHFIQNAVVFENNNEFYQALKNRRDKHQHPFIHILIFIIFIIGLIILSFYYPTISIIFFIVLPIISSLLNLWTERGNYMPIHNKRKYK